MKNRLLGAAVVLGGLALGGGLLGGCASSDPYAAPQPTPSRTTRAPVVAPSGYTSPWWWPAPNSWYPFQ